MTTTSTPTGSGSGTSQPFTVIAGVGGSGRDREVLRRALEEAERRHGRVIVIHAWLSPLDWQMEPTCAPDEERLQREARGRLEQALALIDPDGVPVEPRLVEGEPGPVLSNAADSADLLVVGEPAHRVAAALLGSVTRYCTHHTITPTVVVDDDEDGPARFDPPRTGHR